MSLKSIAEEYFSNLNPIASRMFQDMDETKMSYQELWPSLSEDQQKQILSESIIKPEVSIKYGSCEEDKDNSKYAVKLIIEDNCSYRDEHSGPFSFRTQSQRDLSIVGKEKKTNNKVVKASNIVKPIPKVTG